MATHSSTLAWKLLWQAAVRGVAMSQTRLSDFTFTFPERTNKRKIDR